MRLDERCAAGEGALPGWSAPPACPSRADCTVAAGDGRVESIGTLDDLGWSAVLMMQRLWKRRIRRSIKMGPPKRNPAFYHGGLDEIVLPQSLYHARWTQT